MDKIEKYIDKLKMQMGEIKIENENKNKKKQTDCSIYFKIIPKNASQNKNHSNKIVRNALQK